jgi:hypothetical protein
MIECLHAYIINNTLLPIKYIGVSYRFVGQYRLYRGSVRSVHELDGLRSCMYLVMLHKGYYSVGLHADGVC